MVDGRLRVPTGPGLGVAPDPDRLADTTTSVETVWKRRTARVAGR
jgi:O-succinylbenzoate synthase